MKFSEFLVTRRVQDTVRGDVVADMKRDSRLPEIEGWLQLETYLLARRMPPNAFPAARRLWRDYLRSRRLTSNN